MATVESLRAALAPSSVVPAGGLVEANRAVKSAAEIAYRREAAAGDYAHEGEF